MVRARAMKARVVRGCPRGRQISASMDHSSKQPYKETKRSRLHCYRLCGSPNNSAKRERGKYAMWNPT